MDEREGVIILGLDSISTAPWKLIALISLQVIYTNVKQRNNTDTQFEKRRKKYGKNERKMEQEQLKS